MLLQRHTAGKESTASKGSLAGPVRLRSDNFLFNGVSSGYLAGAMPPLEANTKRDTWELSKKVQQLAADVRSNQGVYLEQIRDLGAGLKEELGQVAALAASPIGAVRA